ncbi:MAG: hypothetical protein IPJ65_16075 [Archangiaceae bacterium]|nr:hypothetical protein [Archangiaceae bacterium]
MNRLLPVALLLAACASMPRSAELAPMVFTSADAQKVSTPPQLVDDHFSRDQTGALSEEHLKEILAAPVFLEAGARLGVVPVAVAYAPDEAVPTVAAPAELVGALEQSGLFEMASEISTEWPIDRGLPGLRELAARYRSEYLLLYRHRFVETTNHNGWAAGYATLIGALFFPGEQLETDGVLEATLYDVKSGTILFTVNERTHQSESAAPTTATRRGHELQAKMLREAAPKLADRVVQKCRRLAASRTTLETQKSAAN